MPNVPNPFEWAGFLDGVAAATEQQQHDREQWERRQQAQQQNARAFEQFAQQMAREQQAQLHGQWREAAAQAIPNHPRPMATNEALEEVRLRHGTEIWVVHFYFQNGRLFGDAYHELRDGTTRDRFLFRSETNGKWWFEVPISEGLKEKILDIIEGSNFPRAYRRRRG